MEIDKILLPVLTAIVGAGVAFLLAIKTESKKKNIEERTKAYVDYVKAVAKMKFSATSDEFLVNLADAVARIAIYGSANVVKALRNFTNTSMILDNDESVSCFLAIIEQMREETSNFVESEDLRRVLFGSK